MSGPFLQKIRKGRAREVNRDKIKNQLYYFWSFYKWIIIAVGIAAALIIYFLAARLTEKETALSVMLMDCHTEISDEQMNQDFAGYIGLDIKRYAVSIQNTLMISEEEGGNYTMTCLARFLSDIGSEKLDVCGMLQQDFEKYDNADTWMELTNCLSEEELKELSDCLYLDASGVPIGLYADQLPMLEEYGCYDSEDDRGVIGIIYNTQRKDMAVSYLKYLAGIGQ